MLLFTIVLAHLILQLVHLILQLGEVGVFLDQRESFPKSPIELDQTYPVMILDSILILLLHDRSQNCCYIGHIRLHLLTFVD